MAKTSLHAHMAVARLLGVN